MRKDALIIAVGVDDLTMAGNSKESIQRFKNDLQTTFKIKDLGDLHWLLRIEVKRDRESCMISSGNYPVTEYTIHRHD
jgi:Reverse transcriptase (RNA-dependent DNA polymerase)